MCVDLIRGQLFLKEISEYLFIECVCVFLFYNFNINKEISQKVTNGRLEHRPLRRFGCKERLEWPEGFLWGWRRGQAGGAGGLRRGCGGGGDPRALCKKLIGHASVCIFTCRVIVTHPTPFVTLSCLRVRWVFGYLVFGYLVFEYLVFG